MRVFTMAGVTLGFASPYPCLLPDRPLWGYLRDTGVNGLAHAVEARFQFFPVDDHLVAITA